MRAALAAALLAPLACATTGRIAAGGPSGEGYEQALSHWTASGQVYSKTDFVDLVVDLWATLQSPAFREARVQRWAQIAGLQPTEVASLQAREKDEARTEIDFFAAMQAEPVHDNDLDQEHSVWHVTLVLPDGRVIAPIAIRAFDPPNVNQRALYPYVRNFWVGYWIRFPAVDAAGRPLLTEGTASVTLHVGSGLGQIDLTYALQRGS